MCVHRVTGMSGPLGGRSKLVQPIGNNLHGQPNNQPTSQPEPLLLSIHCGAKITQLSATNSTLSHHGKSAGIYVQPYIGFFSGSITID